MARCKKPAPGYNPNTDFNDDDTVDDCDLSVITPEFGSHETDILFFEKTRNYDN